MLAGMFAGRIMRGRGYGPLADILLGLVGGIVGSLLFGLIGIQTSGILGGLIVGTIGAVVVVYVARMLGKSQFAR
ncbi:MAG: GlsB/YeaQ/YmgE family stress response membrane protein [Anaerolineae bacterium]|nr:GlsB/YeaQ/YmgE family stress response membrane protein [Anaerolineae bacterium]